MKRTVTPRLSRRLSSACRTCLVKAAEMGVVSSSFRSGTTRFLTRVRGVWPARRPRERSSAGIRPSAVGGAACSYRSPAPRHTTVGPFGRAATAPEDLRLNGQHIAVFLIPCFGQLPLNRLHALFD